MSSLFESDVPEPPSFDLMDIVDEISGTQSRTVTGPDGRQQRVTKRLPRNPEEQKLYDMASEQMTKAYGSIQELSALDPFAVEAFKPILDAFKSREERALDQAINQSTANRENQLARYGLSNSTNANEIRAASGAMENQLRMDINDRTTLLANQLRDDAIARQQNVFGLGQGIVNNDFARANSNNNNALALGIMGGQNQTYQNQLSAYQARGPSFGQQLLGAVGTGVGAYFGGPVGASIGNSLTGNRVKV